jgi:Ca2+:H+ antiporter
MAPLLREIRDNRLLWLLVFVPLLFVVQAARPDSHVLLFVLSVLAIVPLAGLLSRATEAVAAKTGDSVGGLLNATLGNLTELVISLTALAAGQYLLVKATIVGAVVTNALFMLGASFFLGGLKHHIQNFNPANARLQGGLLLLVAIALIMPSAIAQVDSGSTARLAEKLSLGLAVLLIATYALGMLFSLKTHREVFASAASEEGDEAHWPIGLAIATLAVVTVVIALVSEVFVDSVQEAAKAFGMSPAFVGFIIVPLVGGAAEMTSTFSGARKDRGPRRQHLAGQRLPDRALRCARAGAGQLFHRTQANGPAVLAGRRADGAHRDVRHELRDGGRSLDVVRRRPGVDGLSDLRDDFICCRPRRRRAGYTSLKNRSV